MNIVVPMSGGGVITQKGVKKPRYLADIDGIPLFARAITGYSEDDRIYIIVRRQDYEKYNLRKLIAQHVSPKVKVLLLDRQNSGQAETVLGAIKYIDNDDPLVIISPDHITDCTIDDVRDGAESNNALGVIVVADEIRTGDCKFYASLRKGEEYESCLSYEVNYITPDYGKECFAVAGIYYWHFGFQFVRYARKMIEKQHHHDGRYYIAPVFNEAVIDNQKLEVYCVDSSWFIQRARHIQSFIKDLQG